MSQFSPIREHIILRFLQHTEERKLGQDEM